MKGPGNATCAPGKKGSDESSRCLFLWPLLIDDENGSLPDEFVQSGYLDTLGVCLAIDRYKVDVDGDMVPETPFKDCATLPPSSPATTGPQRVHRFDDASDFFCQTRANTPEVPGIVFRQAGSMLGLRPAGESPFELARHSLD